MRVYHRTTITSPALRDHTHAQTDTHSETHTSTPPGCVRWLPLPEIQPHARASIPPSTIVSERDGRGVWIRAYTRTTARGLTTKRSSAASQSLHSNIIRELASHRSNRVESGSVRFSTSRTTHALARVRIHRRRDETRPSDRLIWTVCSASANEEGEIETRWHRAFRTERLVSNTLFEELVVIGFSCSGSFVLARSFVYITLDINKPSIRRDSCIFCVRSDISMQTCPQSCRVIKKVGACNDVSLCFRI